MISTDNISSYGWGVLIAAGGGAYYFAKRSINKDRQERADAELERRRQLERLQYGAPPPAKRSDGHASPGKDSQYDVSPGTEQHVGKSKYESNEPFRSKKGDRFS